MSNQKATNISGNTPHKNDKHLAALTIGYTTYILELDRAIEVLKYIDGAEILDSRYDKDSACSNNFINREVEANLRIFPTVEYHKAKMFGDVLKQERNV